MNHSRAHRHTYRCPMPVICQSDEERQHKTGTAGPSTIVGRHDPRFGRSGALRYSGTLTCTLVFISSSGKSETSAIADGLQESIAEIATYWLVPIAAITFVARLNKPGMDFFACPNLPAQRSGNGGGASPFAGSATFSHFGRTISLPLLCLLQADRLRPGFRPGQHAESD